MMSLQIFRSIRGAFIGLAAIGLIVAGAWDEPSASAQIAMEPGSVSFTSDPGTDGRYELGDTISVDVRFVSPRLPHLNFEAVVTGSPTLTITIGTKAAVARYTSVSTNVVTFEYTTVEGDFDADGISIPANSLRLNGGTIKVSFFPTSYDHAAVTSTHTVDAAAPTLSITYAGSEGVDYVPPGQAYRVQFTFSEPVGAFILQDVAVANGALSGFSRMAATQEHPQSTRWEANVLPSTQGASVVKVEADAASDAAGNGSAASNVLSLWVANPQRVNVQREAGGLVEGGAPAFKLTRASGDVAISVRVTITQSGDFSDGTVSISRSSDPENPTSSSLTFPGAGVLANLITNPPGTSLSASLLVNFAIGETEKLIELPTTDDAEYEANGAFTLTVERKLDQFLYIPGSNFIATATVIDNDAPPTVSIIPVYGTMGEGELARFIISRTTGQLEHSGHIPVTIEWTQTGNYITPITETVRFAHDQDRITILIQTTDDQTREPHGSVTATVVPSDQGRYLVASPSSASVVVQDDDGPRITIEPVSANVTEGTSAVFRVTRHGDTSETLIVLAKVWGHEKVMSRYTKRVAGRGGEQNSDATVILTTGTTEKTFTLTTEADNRVEGDGEIWVGLLPSLDNSYFTDGAPSPNAAVLVVDDDIPTISIAAVTTPEGATLSEDGTAWNASTGEGGEISIRYECSGSFQYGTAASDQLTILNTWVSEVNHPGFYDDRTVGARGLNHMESNVVRVTTADCSSVLNAHDSLRNHRWVGPAGGEVRIDMVPWDTIDPPLYAAARASYATALADAQAQGVPLTTPGLFSPQGVPHNSMRIGVRPSEVRFLPKYQIGTPNAVRVSLVNRAPTILIKADATEVTEGNSAAFTVERRWNAENLADTTDFGATVVLLRASTAGPFVTQTLPTSVRFASGETSKTITIQTNDDTAYSPDGSVTVELLPDTTDATLNLGAKYSTSSTWDGHTPAGGRSDQARVAILDNDPAVFLSHATLGVPEGGTNTYTIRLARQPASEVTITIVDPTDNTEVTASPAHLTFTSTNWATPQPVTVSAASDTDSTDDTATVTHTAAGAEYEGISVPDLPVTVVEEITVEFAASAYTVAEGATVDVTVTLSDDPHRTLTVPLTATPQGNTSAADYSAPASVTFEAGETSKTITFAATDDTLDDDSESVLLGFGTMPEAGVTTGTPNQATINIDDDDTSGIVFSPTSLTVTEEDTTGTSYTVKLGSQPTSTVTVTISGHGGTALTLSGTGLSGDALTFTTSDWDTARTVVVKAAHDDNAVNESITLAHTASGGDYAGASNDLPVTVNDDDPAVTVRFGQTSYTVAEGATVDVTVTLSADPERTVVIPVTATNQGGASSSDYSGVPATVTFASGETSKTITFAATDDTLDDDSESVLLGFGTMPEAGVTTGTPSQTTIDIDDDDTLGIVFTPTALTVTEEDTAGTSYTVKLGSQPTSTVTVTISGHGGTALTLSGTGLSGDALTFTTSDWDTAQTVAVKAAHDDNAGNESITLTHTASGGDYAGASNDLPVTVNDDDPAVTVMFGESSYTVAEGATVDVTVTLSADPERTVVIPVTTTNQGGASSSDYSGVPATVTFASGDTSQTITITATDDTLDDDSESVLLGFGTMPEAGVTAGTPNQATINIDDDDEASGSLDCTTAIWCADLGFSDQSRVDWGWQKLQYGYNGTVDPPSSLSDVSFTFRGVEYVVRSMALEAGPYPTPDNDWSRDEQADSRLRISIRRADDGSDVPLTHYEDWVLHINGLELLFEDGFRFWEGFLWVTPKLQEVYNNWKPSSVTKIGIREVDSNQDQVAGLPWAPTLVRAHGQNGHVMKLRWWRPHWAQFGPTVTGYILQWKPASANWTESASVSERRLGRGNKIVLATVNGLAQNTLYTARVAAFNDVGVGPWSDDSLAQTQPGRHAQQYASVNGSEVTLNFGFPLDEARNPDPSSFVVLVDNGVAKVDSVQVVGSTVVLTLAEAVHGHNYVQALYEEPNSLTAVALHDTDGHRVDTIRYDVPEAVNHTPTSEAPPLTGSITSVPSAHDGATPITFNVEFSEKVWIALGLPRDMLEVEGGRVTSAHAVDRITKKWKVTIQPETRGSIVVTLPGGFCTSAYNSITASVHVPGAPCAPGDRALSNRPTETIRGPESSQQLVRNSPSQGGPLFNGIPKVGQTLSADTSGISDLDGLNNAVFVFRWLADEEAIEGAAGSSYTLAEGDLGKAIRVKVDFADDGGNPETLTSEPTSPVTAAADLELQSATVDGSILTLTYNQTLDTAVSIPPNAFAVVVNGNSRLVTAVAVGQSNVLLSLSAPVEAGDGVTVDYTPPTEEGAARVQDTSGNATASLSGHDVTNVTVARANAPAAGVPTISGTAQVGETLTVSTSEISDADGLINATFSYQWLADDTPISSANSSTYALTSAEQGKAIKVTVTFTDDAANPETRTSAATALVLGPPLTATVHDAPSSHDGTEFTFELRFSETPKGPFSYKTLRDHAFTVTGGEVVNASRILHGKNQRWEIRIRPTSDDSVTIELPATTDCDAVGAICTDDERKLIAMPATVIPGP